MEEKAKKVVELGIEPGDRFANRKGKELFLLEVIKRGNRCTLLAASANKQQYSVSLNDFEKILEKNAAPQLVKDYHDEVQQGKERSKQVLSLKRGDKIKCQNGIFFFALRKNSLIYLWSEGVGCGDIRVLPASYFLELLERPKPDKEHQKKLKQVSQYIGQTINSGDDDYVVVGINEFETHVVLQGSEDNKTLSIDDFLSQAEQNYTIISRYQHENKIS
ncbi:hypothetical protein HGO21_16125 [Acinetobacter sp. CUI P1]|nr:hypothetical protein [Acinetobacter sp. CUI P1]